MGDDKPGEQEGEQAERVPAPDPDPATDPDKDVDRARRKLLTTLVYAAPLVVSSVVVKPAHAQLVSCAPMACRPQGGNQCGPLGCPPYGNPCGPLGCPPYGNPCGPTSCKPRA